MDVGAVISNEICNPLSSVLRMQRCSTLPIMYPSSLISQPQHGRANNKELVNMVIFSAAACCGKVANKPRIVARENKEGRNEFESEK